MRSAGLTLALCVSAVSNGALAGTHSYVEVAATTGTVVFVDTNSMQDVGSGRAVIEFWQLTVLKRLHLHQSYVLSKQQYDCFAKTYRTLAEESYDDAGDPLRAGYATGPADIVPESLAEITADFVCKYPMIDTSYSVPTLRDAIVRSRKVVTSEDVRRFLLTPEEERAWKDVGGK